MHLDIGRAAAPQPRHGLRVEQPFHEVSAFRRQRVVALRPSDAAVEDVLKDLCAFDVGGGGGGMRGPSFQRVEGRERGHRTTKSQDPAGARAGERCIHLYLPNAEQNLSRMVTRHAAATSQG
eukprot:283083-Chlamydomonas_euryale.AAC.2